MAVAQQYPTKPLETFAKCKELRRQHAKHLWEIDKDRVEIMGLAEIICSVPVGFDNYANHGYGANFGRIMDDRDLVTKCLEAWEAQGFGRDSCAICRVQMGSMFLGIQNLSRTGEHIQPTMAFQVHLCDNTAKAAQVLSEYYGVPYLTVDLSNPSQTSRAAREFLVGQLMDAIDFMVKVSGKEYHDEKLIEATHNEWRTLVAWSKIYQLQQAVPAPLDARTLHSLLMPLTNQKEKTEVADFYEELYEEVQERVKLGLSARGFEEARLMLDGIPPYYYPQIMRYPEKYGAVITSSRICFTWGGWGEEENGHPFIPLTPQERGIELKTREDAVRSLAELYLDYVPNIRQFNFSRKIDTTWRLAQEWKTDGVLYHMDRGCKGVTAGGQETVKELRAHGTPAVVFEGSQADPRDFDLAQVQDAIDSFLESLGLTAREG